MSWFDWFYVVLFIVCILRFVGCNVNSNKRYRLIFVCSVVLGVFIKFWDFNLGVFRYLIFIIGKNLRLV